MNGQKSYKVFKRIPCEDSNTKDYDIKLIIKKLESLEAKVNATTGNEPSTVTVDGIK
jgi:hypothetical protein